MYCASCSFPLEAEDYFCRRCGCKTATGATVEVSVKRRLQRAEQDRKLAGVCGGVARYFNRDPRVIRALWVGASLLPFSPGSIAYGICWAVMPKGARKRAEKPSDKPAAAATHKNGSEPAPTA
jgi:phage shock protein C